MFIAFVITPKWKQHNCPSAGDWLSPLCHMHTTELHSAMNREKLLIHTTSG